MILVIDVGNTNIVLGIYERDQLFVHWRIHSDKQQTEDEYGLTIKGLLREEGIHPGDIQGMVISTVVPSLTFALEKMSSKHFQVQPLIVGSHMKTDLPLCYDRPNEIGADRIVNAVGALAEYDPPLIIIDSGTANTFCYINERGEYVGGAIAPGIQITTEALYQYASKLPRVDLKLPDQVIGRNTVHSMQSGMLYGYVGQVDGVVQRMKEETGQNPKVIATGGLADMIASESEHIEVYDPLLTLKGLYILYQKNKQHHERQGGRTDE